MAQIALPLLPAQGGRAGRIVVGTGNRDAADLIAHPDRWPYRTAVLTGPPRSGRSLFAQAFVDGGLGDAVDDADDIEETALFHRWNRAQETGTPLLLTARVGGWAVALPDLASRLSAAQHLAIGPPDDAMCADLILAHAQRRGLALGEGAADYLVPRAPRSYLAIEALVAAIDRLSLERKTAATLGIWRDALDDVAGTSQPRLF